jgi:transcriptional regulator with XRE-family HTH domain
LEILKRFGERIRISRIRKGLTQEQLAKLLDSHENYLGALERGEKNVTLKVVEKIVKELDISLEELFRSIDPIDKYDQITLIAELLKDKSTEDRDFILHMVESMVNWKVKDHH